MLVISLPDFLISGALPNIKPTTPNYKVLLYFLLFGTQVLPSKAASGRSRKPIALNLPVCTILAGGLTTRRSASLDLNNDLVTASIYLNAQVFMFSPIMTDSNHFTSTCLPATVEACVEFPFLRLIIGTRKLPGMYLSLWGGYYVLTKKELITRGSL